MALRVRGETVVSRRRVSAELYGFREYGSCAYVGLWRVVTVACAVAWLEHRLAAARGQQ